MKLRSIALFLILPMLMMGCEQAKGLEIAPPSGKTNTNNGNNNSGNNGNTGQEDPPLTPEVPETPNPGDFIVVGYTTYWDDGMPDPTYLTHINYAFGKIKNDFETLEIKTPSRLVRIVGLKKTNPNLKVVLSIGGWGAGNFSEMAADANHRKKFCQNCLNAVNQYGLDGIDLDWEYPTSGSAGISCR